MALAKQDIKGLLDKQTKTLKTEIDSRLDKRLKPIEKRLAQTVTKDVLKQQFQEQNKYIAGLFVDQNELLKNTYAPI